MTKTTLAALALALSLGACANDPAPETIDETVVVVEEDDELFEDQDDDDDEDRESATPPAAVADAFAAAHPTATDVSWSKEDDGSYEAEFMLNGVETSADYTAAGVAGAVETEIDVADLPAAVTAALDRDYIDAVVTEAARIVDQGQTTYEAEITVDGTLTDLIFQEDGTLVETIPAEND